MKIARHAAVFALALLTCTAGLAQGNASVSSITAVDGGCIIGPTGNTSQKWDVEPGKTYLVTLTGVSECGNGGTDATINVRVNGVSQSEPQNAELTATKISTGVYQFQFAVPLDASCTLPIFYCNTPGQQNTGLLAWRDDGGAWGVHFRASTFEPGCTNPQEIQGENCQIVPTRSSSWGKVKAFYR